jgi:hypothetical protein
LVTGTSQAVGVVSGSTLTTSPTTYAGTTTVGDGTHAASLSAAQILQNTLAINAGSTVTILPFAGGQDGAQPAATASIATPAVATTNAAADDSRQSVSPAATPGDPFTAIQAAIASGAIGRTAGQSLEDRIAAIERIAASDPGLDASLLESRVLAVLPSSSAASNDASLAGAPSVLAASDSSDSGSPSGAIFASPATAFAPAATFAGSPAAVPEPSTLMMSLLAGVVLLYASRRRKITHR